MRGTPALAGLMLLAAGAAGPARGAEGLEAELVAETVAAAPGETLWLAVRLAPAEGWHAPWRVDGGAEEVVRIGGWRLPAGAEAGAVAWPAPEWIPADGGTVFGWTRETLLPAPVTVPAGYEGEEFSASVRVDWLACRTECAPGGAELSLTLPVARTAAPDPRLRRAFAEARARVPAAGDGLSARFNTHDGRLNLMVEADGPLFEGAEDAWFFPAAGRPAQAAAGRDVLLEAERIQVGAERHPELDPARAAAEGVEGVLSVLDGDGSARAWAVRAGHARIAWDHSIEVELLAEDAALAPGRTAWLGLRLDPAEHWHTYWKMGGDSGEPTSLNEWRAPPGAEIGAIRWPAPHWLPFYDTGLVNFGYEEEVLLPFPVTLPRDYAGDSATLSALAYWNVCEQICIPGEMRLDLTLPVRPEAAPDPAAAPLFQAARAALPAADHGLRSFIAVAGERVSLGFESPEPRFGAYRDAWFFPERRRVIRPGPLRDVSIQPRLLQITHQQPRRMLEDLSGVRGVLVLEDGEGRREAFEFAAAAADARAAAFAPPAPAAAGGGPGVAVYMGFALLGGMILNLMPCVFPVLSLKALSFAGKAGQSRRRQRLDGLVYTAGVVAAFVVLASALIALRAGGEAVGWAFQFQQPWFLAFIVYLFFLMGLSLSGVFEIGTGVMGIGGGLAAQAGWRGSFFTGALAAVVATPCTAPFMGPAIGFALSQPWGTAMAVFVSLGLGLALPILALSFMPSLFRLLPKPGPWMETFKQFMAFPLYASALFFLWALGNQVGVMGMALVLGVCVLMAFAAWMHQRRRAMGPIMRGAALAAGIGAAAAAAYLMRTPFLRPAPAALAAEARAADHEAFSAARLDELRAAGRPVFVNMTAAWCITCLANERTSLGTERVRRSMADNGVAYLKGDWTNEDPEITAVLESFNRPSVPLYLLYPGGLSGEPEILPQILTPGILTEAFENVR